MFVGRIDVDDDDLSIHLLQRLSYQRRIFRVDDQDPGASMYQRESNICGIKAGIQRIEHGAEHRHGKMRFDHLRNIRRNDRYRIEPLDPEPRQRGCEPDAAVKQLRVSIAALTVDHRHLLGEGARSAGQEADRRQRYVIGRVSVQICFEGVPVVRIHGITTLA